MTCPLLADVTDLSVALYTYSHSSSFSCRHIFPFLHCYQFWFVPLPTNRRIMLCTTIMNTLVAKWHLLKNNEWVETCTQKSDSREDRWFGLLGEQKICIIRTGTRKAISDLCDYNHHHHLPHSFSSLSTPPTAPPLRASRGPRTTTRLTIDRQQALFLFFNRTFAPRVAEP